VNGTLNIENKREEGYVDIPLVQEGVLESMFLQVKDSALVKNNISQKFQDSVRVGSDIAGDY
jgi:hypothetical protein